MFYGLSLIWDIQVFVELQSQTVPFRQVGLRGEGLKIPWEGRDLGRSGWSEERTPEVQNRFTHLVSGVLCVTPLTDRSQNL